MPQVTEPAQIWEKVKAELSELLPRDIFESWFAAVECLQAEDTVASLIPGSKQGAIMRQSHKTILLWSFLLLIFYLIFRYYDSLIRESCI